MRIKRALPALLFAMVVMSAKAQVGEYRNKWNVGFNGGVNLNKVGFNPRVKQTYQIGPGFGAMIRYTSEKYFKAVCSLQLEVNYNSLGYKEQNDEQTYSFSRKMNYIQVPLLAHMAWGREEKGIQFFFNAGPYANFLVSKEKTADGDESLLTNYHHINETDNDFDFGIIAGIGTEINTSVGRFDLEVRYDYGLGNIYDNSKKGYYSISNNATINARIAYFIPIKK